MHTKPRTVGVMVVLVSVLILAVVLGRPAMRGLTYLASPLPTPATPTVPAEDRPTPMLPPPLAPTKVTETPPPVPTPVPTPIVTPVPLATPPFIPGLEEVTPQPFRIFLREENRVWMANEDGSDRQLLVDTEARAGLYLGHYPVQGIEGPPLRWGSPSPDGTRVALVVTDLWEPAYKGQPFDWEIHLLDVATGDLRFLVVGREPVWSPDGSHIAYIVQEGALGVVDVNSGSSKTLFSTKEEQSANSPSWSPDGRQIAFSSLTGGMGGKLEMWVADAEGRQAPVRLPTMPGGYSPKWSANGELLSIAYERDSGTAQWFHNLQVMDQSATNWRRTTHEAAVMVYAPAPQGDWVVFAGGESYEESSLSYDLWLLDVGEGSLVRLTRGSSSDDPQWSPDGTRIVYRRTEAGIWVLNLLDGTFTQVYEGPADFAVAAR